METGKKRFKKICVFCGASPGARPEYAAAARQMGRELAARKIGLVYGGGSVGLMGELARAALAEGGLVTGVITRSLLERRVGFDSLPDLRVVGSMHERKALMAGLSDAFIALPGGMGTIEEFFEMATWAQLGLHKKPCGLLNTCGFFDKLSDFTTHMVNEKFIARPHKALIIIEKKPSALLNKLSSFKPPLADKAKWALSFEPAAE